jgi:hypothetical protein
VNFKNNKKIDDKNNIPTELISEKYGGKKQIYLKRDDNNASYLGVFIISTILILIFIVAAIVYFM